MRVRELYLYCAFILGIMGFVSYFFDIPVISQTIITFQEWIVVMSACMLGMGAYNISAFNIKRVKNKRSGWPYSIVLLASFVFMILVGVIDQFDIKRPEFFFYQNAIITPANSVLWGMQMLYIVSAAFRSFRPRNLDSAALLFGAVFALFYTAPISDSIHPALPKIGEFLFTFSGVTGMRALLIGVAVGVAAVAVRIIMGKEKRSLGGWEA